jgi:mannose-6-phosphate isomerase-like protein (cupin superfamily)
LKCAKQKNVVAVMSERLCREFVRSHICIKERPVPTLIAAPTRVQAAGNLPKLIDEYIGRLNTKEERLSVAHMRSPAGWQEPGQTPEFLEYTVVLKGTLVVTHKAGAFEVRAGQAVVSHPGEWIQYSTPDEATEYIAVCLPAFSPATVHRDQ